MSARYKKLSGIYTITNIITNKIYVGSCTTSIKQRFSNHINSLKNNKHRNSYLQRSYNKYGHSNFKFEILEECEPNLCISTEQFWINMLNVTNRSFGYNLAGRAGNSMGQKRTPQQCLNISKSVKGKRVGKLNPNYGKKWSYETRLKIENSTRNKKVLQYNLNNEYLKEFKSIAEAEKYINKSKGLIGKVCNNKYKSAFGFIWKFKK